MEPTQATEKIKKNHLLNSKSNESNRWFFLTEKHEFYPIDIKKRVYGLKKENTPVKMITKELGVKIKTQNET